MKATLTGDKKLIRQLTGLQANVGRKYMRRALRAGAKPIKKLAVATSPVDTGKMKKAIRVRAGRSRKNGFVSVLVSIGKKWFVGDLFYAGFVVFGHALVRRRLGRYSKKRMSAEPSRGRVEPNTFLQDAMERGESAAKTAITESLREQIERGV